MKFFLFSELDMKLTIPHIPCHYKNSSKRTKGRIATDHKEAELGLIKEVKKIIFQSYGTHRSRKRVNKELDE